MSKDLLDVSEFDIENYLDNIEVPEEKRPSAKIEIDAIVAYANTKNSKKSNTNSKRVDEALIRDQQIQMKKEAFASVFKILQSEDRTKQSVRSEIMDDAFRCGGLISAIIPELVKDKVTWDVKGAIVEDEEDMAMLARMLRTPYFESIKMVIVDKDNIVMRSSILSVGTLSSSLYSPALLIREITSLSDEEVRNAKGVILSHNHPSGKVSPSSADVNMTRKVDELLNSVGIPLIDHVITNGKNCYSFAHSHIISNNCTLKGHRLSHIAKREGMKQTEKLGVPEGVLQTWEVVDRETLPVLSGGLQLYDLRNKLGNGNYLVYCDRKNTVVGIEKFRDVDSLSISQIAMSSAKAAACALTVILDKELDSSELSLETKKISKLIPKNSDVVQLLDVMSIQENGHYKCAADEGFMFEDPVSYGSANEVSEGELFGDKYFDLGEEDPGESEEEALKV